MPAPPAVSPEAVRDFLRQAAELGAWTTNDAARFLGLKPADTKQALTALQTVGYIAPVARARDTWRNTPAGDTMAGVSHSKPIKRETAEDKLDEFVERVQKINQDRQHLYRVTRAVLYGPFLNKEAKIKNIDVAVALEPKEKNKEKHEAQMRKRAEDAEAAGKHFTTYRARREWGKREVMDFLKSRSRAINLSELTDWIVGQPHKDLL